MSRILTFSRTFPAYHPRKGEPTYFVEKILQSFKTTHNELLDGARSIINHEFFLHNYQPKHHTIRAGNRWKVGDKFSPRVWSGNPYASKMITIAPDIEIKKVWDFEIEVDGDYTCILIDKKPYCEMNSKMTTNTGQLDYLAKNDGLNTLDLLYWFKHPSPFSAQIICWNDSVSYI